LKAPTDTDGKPSSFPGRPERWMECRNRDCKEPIAKAGQPVGTFSVSNEEEILPAERLSMGKIKEILPLKFEAGLGNWQIARSSGVNHSTVAGE
jgi:hypothetical protein